jgi:NADPH-dependent 2,4-dienoyl-CoA reductase/sulfur reductase-like enzyme
MDEVECVVVGAGVIGLAVARALALTGIEVLVLEQAYTIGSRPRRATAKSSMAGSITRSAV